MQPLEMYAGARRRLLDLVAAVPAEGVSTPVAGTPGWTVHDVVAHLAGVASDVNRGRLEGAGTPDWTARQVAERRERSMVDLIGEWEAEASLVADVSTWMGMDALVHEHDIRAALGETGPGDAVAVDTAVQGLVHVLGRRLERGETPALRLVAGDTEWIVGPGEPAATVTVAAGQFELFRALMGRRSAAQVVAYGWQGDPEPYLPHLSLFGPLPDADVVEPT